MIPANPAKPGGRPDENPAQSPASGVQTSRKPSALVAQLRASFARETRRQGSATALSPAGREFVSRQTSAADSSENF